MLSDLNEIADVWTRLFSMFQQIPMQFFEWQCSPQIHNIRTLFVTDISFLAQSINKITSITDWIDLVSQVMRDLEKLLAFNLPAHFKSDLSTFQLALSAFFDQIGVDDAKPQFNAQNLKLMNVPAKKSADERVTQMRAVIRSSSSSQKQLFEPIIEQNSHKVANKQVELSISQLEDLRSQEPKLIRSRSNTQEVVRASSITQTQTQQKKIIINTITSPVKQQQPEPLLHSETEKRKIVLKKTGLKVSEIQIKREPFKEPVQLESVLNIHKQQPSVYQPQTQLYTQNTQQSTQYTQIQPQNFSTQPQITSQPQIMQSKKIIVKKTERVANQEMNAAELLKENEKLKEEVKMLRELVQQLQKHE
ncbi:Hypothetical_protein [Hexamita inflata]|uniref:Hypothetical_protein n=1 Tax=Hexamita inflata TaxID=28002 RepID=A0AA86R9Q4_9EUKA|nr:Hypothetical protein HINF_LOCUS56557 [Hexamita inflata]